MATVLQRRSGRSLPSIHAKEDAPAGARPMALRFLAVPEPEDPAPGPPPGNAEPAVAG